MKKKAFISEEEKNDTIGKWFYEPKFISNI